MDYWKLITDGLARYGIVLAIIVGIVAILIFLESRRKL